MKINIIESHQNLPISLLEAWDFFSNPGNLKEITPSYLNFIITSKLPEKMYPGLIITYKVHPILNIPVQWVTEITHVEEPNYFVDEQRFGPYSLWHHEHHFKEIEGGVAMTDRIHYAVPFGIFGSIANVLLVRKQVEGIFQYRSEILEKRFGTVK